jgi:hypothetical protein
VSHEPPIARVHPKAKKLQRFFAGVYWMAFRFGTTLALLRFSYGVGLPTRQLAKAQRDTEIQQEMSHERRIRPEDASDFLVKQELLPVTNYLPDVAMIKRNGVRVCMAAGKMSLEKKRFYAETASILAEKLGCDLVTFPGHHGSYMDMPNEFAATLRSVLHKAEGVSQCSDRGNTNCNDAISVTFIFVEIRE